MGIAIVGNRNADTGNETSTRKPDQPGPERPKRSAAMAQQCADSGHQSAPQKLPQLVGCREAKAAPGSKPNRDPKPAQR